MVPKWELVTLKWEGNIHKWEVVIALSRPADNSNSNARKSQANADGAGYGFRRRFKRRS